MNSQDNPYFNLVEALVGKKKESLSNGYYVGTVISNYPLLVQVGEIQLERKEMLINTSYLIVNKPIGSDYTENSFDVGEKLVLLNSLDQQEFILIAKVR